MDRQTDRIPFDEVSKQEILNLQKKKKKKRNVEPARYFCYFCKEVLPADLHGCTFYRKKPVHVKCLMEKN